MPRTIDSLRQIVRGLYPSTTCNLSLLPPILVRSVLYVAIVTILEAYGLGRNGRDENLYGNSYSCQRLNSLLQGFARGSQ